MRTPQPRAMVLGSDTRKLVEAAKRTKKEGTPGGEQSYLDRKRLMCSIPLPKSPFFPSIQFMRRFKSSHFLKKLNICDNGRSAYVF